MNFVKNISGQFGNPEGLAGKIITKLQNVFNKKLYVATKKNLICGKNAKVLDIGFGNGYMLEQLAKSSSIKLMGIDISRDMLENATKRCNEYISEERIKLSVGNVSNLEFTDHSIDEVYTINTIYFWEDIDKGFREVFRVLKPKGAFVNTFCTKNYLDKVACTKYGFAKYSEKEIEEVAVRNNFTVEKVITIKKGMCYSYRFRKSISK